MVKGCEGKKDESDFNCTASVSCNIAHEINNYLTSMSLSLQILRLKIEQTSNESIVMHDIDLVEGYLYNASRASRNPMAINRLDKAEFQRININTIIMEVVALMAGVLNIRVHYELSVAVHVRGNYMPLKACFTHILRNTIESIPEGRGSVTISTSLCGDKIRIDVVDAGCGVSRECVSKVFEPCFTTKDKADDLGLGLIVVYELISQHGGEVEFDSSPDKGTRVSIVLPSEDEQ
ncbi:ATP-binding region, ATPase-like domain protein [Candidatus Magnetobacterium bavaricum]|uniref:histidine kinase n=1 Tax=Candidatus Magnetobacterium bavaricum TaxID=29290 RepID=A0A0F3GQG6_9BACT|nr:ATP-binding region, ATPase-like domain protein [Candidatus Magnetobacterium bavaricum]